MSCRWMSTFNCFSRMFLENGYFKKMSVSLLDKIADSVSLNFHKGKVFIILEKRRRFVELLPVLHCIFIEKHRLPVN